MFGTLQDDGQFGRSSCDLILIEHPSCREFISWSQTTQTWSLVGIFLVFFGDLLTKLCPVPVSFLWDIHQFCGILL